jgi:hypothetical protein
MIPQEQNPEEKQTQVENEGNEVPLEADGLEQLPANLENRDIHFGTGNRENFQDLLPT